MGLPVDGGGLSVAIGLAGVIKVSGFPAEESGVDDILVVQSEHVAVANAFFFVHRLSDVGHFVSYDLTHVLDQDVAFLQSLLSEEPDPVDFTLAYLQFLWGLEGLSILGSEGQGRVACLLGVIGGGSCQLLLNCVANIFFCLLKLASDRRVVVQFLGELVFFLSGFLFVN